MQRLNNNQKSRKCDPEIKGSVKKSRRRRMITVFKSVKGCYERMRRNVWCSWTQSIERVAIVLNYKKLVSQTL